MSSTPASVHRLRKDNVRPDFESSEDTTAVGAVETMASPAPMTRRRRQGHVAARALADVEARGPPVVRVSLAGLAPEHIRVFEDMCTLLEGYPLLKGGLMPTVAELESFEPLMKYLRAHLCRFPEADSRLNLKHLLSVLSHTPGLQHVSPAVAAAVLIELGLQVDSTWTSAAMNKLELWEVAACFWDMHVTCSLAGHAAATMGQFHRDIVSAARELSLGPVRLSGHKCLLHLAMEYRMMLQCMTRPVVKEARDCLDALFMVRDNLVHLYHAIVADALDSLSVPLPALRVSKLEWDVDLEAAVAPTSSARVDRRLASRVVALASPYAWLFVCAYHITVDCHPSLENDSWDRAVISWDECALT